MFELEYAIILHIKSPLKVCITTLIGHKFN